MFLYLLLFVVVSRWKCLLMYLLTTITPPAGILKWRLVSKPMMYDNIVTTKHGKRDMVIYYMP